MHQYTRARLRVVAITTAAVAVAGALAVGMPTAASAADPYSFAFGGSGECTISLDVVTRGATDTVLTATAQGWYDKSGAHYSSNPNYIVGGADETLYRNWVVFDASALDPATISSASVTYPAGGVCGNGSGELRALVLHDVATTIDRLTSDWTAGPDGLAIFDDLADGAVLGSVDVTSATADVTVQLSGAGIAELIAAAGHGSIAIGGTYEHPATRTALVAAPADSARFGDVVELSATVSAFDAGTPSGTVEFTAGGSAVDGCEAVAVADGVAHCEVDQLPVGTVDFRASYSGDSTYSASDDALVGYEIAKAKAAVSIAANAASAVVGTRTTFTGSVAKVGGVVATGDLSFLDDGVTLDGCDAVALDPTGKASCATTLPKGSHSVTVAYAGDGTFSDGVSDAVDVAVSPTPVVVPPATKPQAPVAKPTPLSVTAPARVIGGEKARVRATGLRAGETFRVFLDSKRIGHGTASAAGTGVVRVKIPGATKQGRHKLEVRGVTSKSTGTDRVSVLAKKAKLALSYKPAGTVQANRMVTITVRGLASHEHVRLVYNGKRVSAKKATANVHGVYRLRTTAGWGWGARTATATGAGEKRTGTLRVIVGPRIN